MIAEVSIPWSAISLVSSGVTLVAFLGTIAALVHRQQLAKAELLIKNAPDQDRAKLVAQAMEKYHIETAGLSTAQRSQLVSEHFRHLEKKQRVIATVVVIIAFLGAGVAVFELKRQQHAGDVALNEIAEWKAIVDGQMASHAVVFEHTRATMRVLDAKLPPDVSSEKCKDMMDVIEVTWGDFLSGLGEMQDELTSLGVTLGRGWDAERKASIDRQRPRLSKADPTRADVIRALHAFEGLIALFLNRVIEAVSQEHARLLGVARRP